MSLVFTSGAIPRGGERIMTDKRILLTTASSKEEAEKIANALVERRAAACVNIVSGMQSVYRWQGAIEKADEWLLLIKTTAAAVPQAMDTIRELHSYQVPEMIVLPIEMGSDAYLSWIDESVSVKIKS